MAPEATRFTQGAVALSLKLHKIGLRQALEDDEFEAGGASKEMVSASKKLFDDCDELDAIRSYLSQTKRRVEALSLPSGFRGGMWFVKTTTVEELDAYLEERASGLAPIVEKFVAVLDQRVAEAKAKLGALAANAKWPTAARVRRRFKIEYSWLVFETPESLKGLSKGLYNRERQKMAGSLAEAREAGLALLRSEMQGLVTHMLERLAPGDDGKAKIFKKGTVEGLADFLTNFEKRNLVDDEELGSVVKKAAKLLDGVDAKMLRDEEGVRNAVTRGFGAIKEAVDKLVTDKPRRALDFTDDDAE